MELEFFLSLDLFLLTFINIFLALLRGRGAIAPPHSPYGSATGASHTAELMCEGAGMTLVLMLISLEYR